MAIKFLTKEEEMDIHCGLTRKIKFNRQRLSKWMRDHPEHPDRNSIILKKMARITELERLRTHFAKPYSYE